MLSHRNLCGERMQGAAWFPRWSSGEEALLAALPFFHSYGMLAHELRRS